MAAVAFSCIDVVEVACFFFLCRRGDDLIPSKDGGALVMEGGAPRRPRRVLNPLVFVTSDDFLSFFSKRC